MTRDERCPTCGGAPHTWGRFALHESRQVQHSGLRDAVRFLAILTLGYLLAIVTVGGIRSTVCDPALQENAGDLQKAERER